MPTTRYHVLAYNSSHNSENKIHDDTVAKKFGFSGGLVPGVDVYAYMAHLPVSRWGRAWLERGAAECRFGKPVYDGDIAEVNGDDSAGAIAISVESKGVHCATGSASLPEAAPAAPDVAAYRVAANIPMESRPPASTTTLATGTWLSPNPLEVTPEFAATYLKDLRERDEIYAKEGLVHPGTVLRLCNWALSHNVVLGPWIHVGSKVQNFGVALVGETLTARSRVINNYEHKGHLFVDLDVLVLSQGDRPVAQITHTAIYRPRQVAAAA